MHATGTLCKYRALIATDFKSIGDSRFAHDLLSSKFGICTQEIRWWSSLLLFGGMKKNPEVINTIKSRQLQYLGQYEKRKHIFFTPILQGKITGKEWPQKKKKNSVASISKTIVRDVFHQIYFVPRPTIETDSHLEKKKTFVSLILLRQIYPSFEAK